MARGGKREGAGRKKGSGNGTIQARADAALVQVQNTTGNLLPFIEPEIARLSPYEVMHMVMAVNVQSQQWDAAQRCARDLAPYVHARLANINVNHTDDKPITAMTMEELSAVVRSLDLIDEADIIEPDTEAGTDT